MTICGDATLVKRGGGKRVAATLLCRSWNCETCQPNRRKRLIAQGIRGQPNRFITLTFRPRPGLTPDLAAAELAHAWKLLKLRIQRRYHLKTFHHLTVIERHKSGWPHLHALVRSCWIDQTWLSTQMLDLADSPIVDIRAIDSIGRVASYVAKYIGKQPHKFGTCKRYWQSRSYQLYPYRPRARGDDGLSIWEIERRPIWRIVQEWTALGCSVEWDEHGRAVATGPPDWTGLW